MTLLEIYGNVGADAERVGDEVRFSVGVDVAYKDGRPLTRWHYCHARSAGEEVVNSVKRGARVWVRGIPRVSSRLNGSAVDVFWHLNVIDLRLL